MRLSTAEPRTRTPETEAAYLREGRRHLARAKNRLRSQPDDLEALVDSLLAETEVLTPATINLYMQELAAIIRVIGAERNLSDDDLQNRLDAIWMSFQARRGRPPQQRTSSKKITDPGQEETLTVLRYLGARVKQEGQTSPVLALGLVIFYGRIAGCRPIEWTQASVENDQLILSNAKATNGRAGFKKRTILLHGLSSKQRAYLPFSICILQQSIAAYGGYTRWHGAMAELLARSCRAVGVRRLCLYGFRHVAIATWRRVGLTPWQIAALAGHRSLAAGRGYGQGSKGWQVTTVVAPEAARVDELQAAAKEEVYSGSLDASPPPGLADLMRGHAYVFDDMPMPARENTTEAFEEGAQLWDAYKRQQEADFAWNERLGCSAGWIDRRTIIDPEQPSNPDDISSVFI